MKHSIKETIRMIIVSSLMLIVTIMLILSLVGIYFNNSTAMILSLIVEVAILILLIIDLLPTEVLAIMLLCTMIALGIIISSK